MKNCIKYIFFIFLVFYLSGCGKSGGNSGLNVGVNRAPSIQFSYGCEYTIELIISGAVSSTQSDTFLYSDTYVKNYPLFEFDAEGAVTIRVNILFDTTLIASGSASAVLVRGSTAEVNLVIDKTGSQAIAEEALCALQSGNWLAARDSYALAVSMNPANYDAHLGYVATNLGLLVDTDSIQSLLKDIWDVYGTELKINPLDPDDTVPSSRDYLDTNQYTSYIPYAIKYSQSIIKKASKGEINSSRLQNILLNTILPEINGSINSIDIIIQNNPYYQFNITYAMTPDPYDHSRDNKYTYSVLYQIDRPSLEALKAILSALKGTIYYVCSYDFDMDDYSDTNFKSITTRSALTSRYPYLGTLKTTNYISDFRQSIISALESAKNALLLAKEIRDAGGAIPEKLYDVTDLTVQEFNDAVEAIDTGLYYVRDANALTGNSRIDIDFNGVYETAYPNNFFSSPIQDMKVLMPDVFDTDIQSTFSFAKSDLNFIFSDLSDEAFNKFKRNINIKRIHDYFNVSFSKDYDNDGIADLSVNSTSGLIISAAQNKKIIEIDGKIPVTVDVININSGEQSLSVNTSNDPSYGGMKGNIRLFGFQTSTGLYGIARIFYNINTSYYYYNWFVSDVYINMTGENQFWNYSRQQQFTVYGRNDMADYAVYSDTNMSLLRKGKATPSELGWNIIGTYTVASDSTEVIVNSEIAYKNFLIVTTKDSYVILSPEIQMTYYNSWSNGGFVLAGGCNEESSMLYEIFDAEYLVNDNSNYNHYFSGIPYSYYKRNGFFEKGEIYGLYSISNGSSSSNSITIKLLKENRGI
ncbi:hypothetical protein KA977_08145 [Candidatus Dependentiae bacterium]|nr:hypothetical protein [Candidatus Dependentiae bacterium]